MAVGRAIDGGVVADHQVAVPRGVHVELDAGGPGVDRAGDGVQGRGRPLPGPALVRVGDDPTLQPWVLQCRRRAGGMAER